MLPIRQIRQNTPPLKIFFNRLDELVNKKFSKINGIAGRGIKLPFLALFSKSGFTEGWKMDTAERKDTQLFDLKDLFGVKRA
jgi:hypothetical protein